jgi:hypothetical protein
MPKAPAKPEGDDHLGRVRRICLAMAETSEKLSHGAPTFFARKRTFAMFVHNHHRDGHIAVWTAAVPGAQAALIAASPKTYFRPPYVGVKGWIGIELPEIDDEDLAAHLTDAWRLVMANQGKSPAQRKPKALTRSPGGLVRR